MNAEVVSVNISTEKGTVKDAVPSIEVNEQGVVGDAHAGAWHRQISLLSRDVVDSFEKETGKTIANGAFAENITTRGIDLSSVAVLDRLTIGDVQLEVTQLGKECHGDGCAIFREIGKCVMPKAGVFCRVLKGGGIIPGAVIQHMARPFKCLIITASDRAKAGVYEDRSGPEVEKALSAYFEGGRWHPEIERHLVADDLATLISELEAFHGESGDVVVITGGTGIGPRDVSPEAVTTFCDKTIPGVMEAIRVKYGADKPGALLSRSVAGIKGRMLVYAIPGSVKAVKEYMAEILKTIEHAVRMLHGIDAH
jgi:molybdopterin adenylyltransferase